MVTVTGPFEMDGYNALLIDVASEKNDQADRTARDPDLPAHRFAIAQREIDIPGGRAGCPVCLL